MANLLAIHSVGSSIITYLRNSYPEALRNDHSCEFALLSSGELIETGDINNTLSLFLYRVTVNEHLRNAGRGSDLSDAGIPLSVDLHYLMTVWADTALHEQVILAWAMRQLHLHPTLSASSLSPEAEWGPGDLVQLIPAELSTEDIMRIWDALIPPYRLSVSYIARVVRIDPDPVASGRPVVATQLSATDREAQA